MSVLRQLNILGQERVDVVQFRLIDSSIAADFDLLGGKILSGQNALIIKGFEVGTANVTGGPATNLQMNTASSILVNFNSSESGSIFSVPADRAVEQLSTTNPRLTGSFTANQTNYVGVDLRRTADSSTADLAVFLGANTLQEKTEEVPLGRTLDYIIVVTTTDFSSLPTVTPVAIVITDVNNNVVSVTDARNLMYRLGSGGVSPNRLNTFSWPSGRNEGTSTEFFGGDKIISSLKGWMDSIMTRVWEIGGGQYWYSPTADRNVSLAAVGSAFTSNQEYFEWDGTNLHWKGLKFVFENSGSGVWYNDIANQITDLAGLTNLADGECIYVDLDRTANRTGGTALTPIKGVTATLGISTIPGARQIIAWRIGANIWTRNSHFPVGTFFALTPLSPDPSGSYVSLNATIDNFGRVITAADGYPGLTVQENGSTVGTALGISTINFSSGVVAVGAGSGATITVPWPDTGGSTPTWADTTTNPALASVQLEIAKIINDLATGTGTAKIHGAAYGSAPRNLAAGTLESQIHSLVDNWANLAAGNTFTGAVNTFNQVIELGDSLLSSVGAQAMQRINMPAGLNGQLDQVRDLSITVVTTGVSTQGYVVAYKKSGAYVAVTSEKRTVIGAAAPNNTVNYLAVSGLTPAPDTVEIWRPTNTGSGGVGLIGSQAYTGAGSFNDTALTATPGTTPIIQRARTLLIESRSTDQNVAVRLYSSQWQFLDSSNTPHYTKSLEITSNAFWNGSAWSADSTSCKATRYIIDNEGMSWESRATVTGTWADFAFAEDGQIEIDVHNSRVKFDTPSGYTYPAANDTSSRNTVGPKNIIQCWGTAQTDGAGNVTLLDGHNVGSLGVLTTSTIPVVFATPMTTATYAVNVTENDTQSIRWGVLNKTINGFDIHTFDQTLTTQNVTVGFMVVGR